jgi:non-canonical purine NTP pyrophosphatase (RdgB/HAM1 family)
LANPPASQLYFITGNAGKFREIQAVLPAIEQLSLDLDEIQSLRSQDVIEHKLAQAAASHAGSFIVEDTSVGFACIHGLPGTLIKWFLDTLGAAGLADLVLRYPDHRATVLTTIGYRDEAGHIHYFTGEYSGQVVEPRGNGGFGFDPIFVADGQTKTNAELSSAEKIAISARGIAARKLAAHLKATSTPT